MEDSNTCSFNPANGSMPNTNPWLDPLQDNGGPNFTHAVPWNSEAIDAGDNAICLSTDQRGFPRLIDGNWDGIAICDIGAYEFDGPPPKPFFLPLVINSP